MSDIDILIREYQRAYLKAEASHWGNVAYHVEDLTECSIYMRFRSGRQALWQRPVLVLATIDVKNPGNGFFSKLLAETKALCKERDWVLQLENVLTPQFRRFLSRGGFTPQGVDSDSDHGSMYWFHDESILSTTPMRPEYFELIKQL
ncbi:hypothetical protein pEaSNUABM52_00271 [Erwinia phage pEp_SNUABM_52]|nr:hypothetical protein pEaSNUABM52_00271 [Erwinia phage pEp_SNUABM_52]